MTGDTHPAATGSVREIERLRGALEDVCNPLGYLQRRAEAEGSRLGGMAYAIANDIATVQRIAREALAAAPTPDAAAIRLDSWTAAPKDVREQVLLLAEVEFHLQSCRVFLTTREKMHPCGVDLHDELLAKVTAAIETIGREKANG